MAKRRMISVDVFETDRFYRLAPSSQCLYVHMILNADDDGLLTMWKVLCELSALWDDTTASLCQADT